MQSCRLAKQFSFEMAAEAWWWWR